MVSANAAKSQIFTGIVPVLSSIVAGLIMLLPFAGGGDNVLVPNLVLITVFYWLVHRPLLIPYGACAAIGFFMDLWLNIPLGLTMMMLVLTRLFVLNQLKFFRGRGRLFQWTVFGGFSFGLYLGAWVFTAIIEWQIRSPLPDLFHWLSTAFSYAPISFLLGRLRRAI